MKELPLEWQQAWELDEKNATIPANDAPLREAKPASRWTAAGLKRDEKGRATNCENNLLSVLTEHPDWAGVIRMSECDALVYFVDPPFKGTALDYGSSSDPRCRFRDDDFTRISMWMNDRLSIRFPKETIVSVVGVVARKNQFNPIRDYLKGLEWDGKSRVSDWLETYLGADVSSASKQMAVRAVAKRWLIAAVARVMKPGCKVDSTIILEGKQGAGKSSALRALLPNEDWFSDEKLNFDSKDTFQQMQGKWIIEIAELASVRGKEAEDVKHFLTKQADDYRSPYARLTESRERRCVFAGTVNEAQYLKDATGNRRFWPVHCAGIAAQNDRIDVAGLAAVRDQLWAEAVSLFNTGEKWWLDIEEEEALLEEQELRFTNDPWEDAIKDWLDGLNFWAGAPRQDRVKIGDVLAGPLGIPAGKQTQADQTHRR